MNSILQWRSLVARRSGFVPPKRGYAGTSPAEVKANLEIRNARRLARRFWKWQGGGMRWLRIGIILPAAAAIALAQSATETPMKISSPDFNDGGSIPPRF